MLKIVNVFEPKGILRTQQNILDGDFCTCCIFPHVNCFFWKVPFFSTFDVWLGSKYGSRTVSYFCQKLHLRCCTPCTNIKLYKVVFLFKRWSDKYIELHRGVLKESFYGNLKYLLEGKDCIFDVVTFSRETF